MKLSEWKLHIEDLIEKYGDVDIEYYSSGDRDKANGFAVGKEFTFIDLEGVISYEFNHYDDSFDETLMDWYKDEKLLKMKYVFDINYEKIK